MRLRVNVPPSAATALRAVVARRILPRSFARLSPESVSNTTTLTLPLVLGVPSGRGEKEVITYVRCRGVCCCLARLGVSRGIFSTVPSTGNVFFCLWLCGTSFLGCNISGIKFRFQLKCKKCEARSTNEGAAFTGYCREGRILEVPLSATPLEFK